MPPNIFVRKFWESLLKPKMSSQFSTSEMLENNQARYCPDYGSQHWQPG